MVVSWQLIRRLPAEDAESLYDAVREIWREAGLTDVEPYWREPTLPDEVEGVPWAEIAGRKRGGGAGSPGDAQAGVHILATIWPYVAGALAAKATGDVWDAAKTRMGRALHALLSRTVETVTIEIPDQDSAQRPDRHYDFTRDNLDDLDDALDALAEHEIEIRGNLTISTTTWYTWDPSVRAWVAHKETRRVTADVTQPRADRS